MKINEKNLCAYSVSPSHIDKEGYLLKKGEVNKSFQRRWFVLKGNLLFYFEKKGDREPLGVIILEGCTIELAECEEQFTFKLVFHGGGGRTYILCADSQEALEVWMKALARASYDYLKLMVAELQKQLDELNEVEDGREGGISQAPKPPHRQRQNPFNRTQSTNEVALDPGLALRMRANTVSGGGRGAAGSGGGGRGTYLPSSTTTPARAAPPPPSTSSVSYISINRRTFIQLHTEYGVAILRDREKYVVIKRSKGSGGREERDTTSKGRGSISMEWSGSEGRVSGSGGNRISGGSGMSGGSGNYGTDENMSAAKEERKEMNIPLDTESPSQTDAAVVVANLVEI